MFLLLYYGVQTKPIDIERIKLKALICQVFNDSKQSADVRTIAAKLMEQMNLVSCQLKTHKYKHADQAHRTHDNILDRRFSPDAPNQV